MTRPDVQLGRDRAGRVRRIRLAAAGSVVVVAGVAVAVTVGVGAGAPERSDTLSVAAPAAAAPSFDRGYASTQSTHALGTSGRLYPAGSAVPAVSWDRAQDLTASGLAITKVATGVSGELGRFTFVDKDGKEGIVPTLAWVVRYHNAPLVNEAEYLGVYDVWPCDAVTVLDATTGAVMSAGKDCQGPFPTTPRYAGPPGTGALPLDGK